MSRHFALNSHVNTIVNNLPVSEDDVPALLEVVRRQRDLIQSEFEELRDDGVKARNVQEVRDGIADVIVTTDGMFFRLGLEYPNVSLWDTDDRPVEEFLRAIEVDLTMIQNMLAFGLDGQTVGYFKHRIKVYCESILHACYQISLQYGIDLQDDQDAVYASNMTKFDTDIEVARKGVEKYASIGVKTDIFPNTINGLTYHVIKCVADCEDVKGKKYGAGKFLKSIYFQEPIFGPLVDACAVD